MSSSRTRVHPVTVLALALTVAGCRHATRPDLDPSLAAGTYVLDAPAFRGPSTGTFILTADGKATNRVQYPEREPEWGERTLTGTFRLVRADSIHFMLSDNTTPLRPLGATRAGERFTVRSPHPADGEVVEVYRRVDP